MRTDPYLPQSAEVIERIQESRTIFTLRLRLCEAEAHGRYSFIPGQFNMVYLFGVGEIPISIVSDPQDEQLLDHAIRVVGRVTRGLSQLDAGDRLGIRGPYGRGWPLQQAEGRDVIIITGGLGCAPVVSVINYIMRRRQRYGRLTIMQGVKHSDDLIWRARYARWAQQPDTQVLLAADMADRNWEWTVGPVTALFEQAELRADSIAMMCGPERMMLAAASRLIERGIGKASIWLSTERNMQCALGHCGHCQYGKHFVCRDGPIFSYPEIEALLGVEGF